MLETQTRVGLAVTLEPSIASGWPRVIATIDLGKGDGAERLVGGASQDGGVDEADTL